MPIINRLGSLTKVSQFNGEISKEPDRNRSRDNQKESRLQKSASRIYGCC